MAIYWNHKSCGKDSNSKTILGGNYMFKRLLCKHEWELIQPALGDAKNQFIGLFRCSKCGKEKLK